MQAQRTRTGAVYLVVLGVSLIVTLLALSALALARLQMREQVASAEMRQAQLNAAAAVQLGLLTIKENDDWRSTASAGTWFSDQDTGQGLCNLEVSDPKDGNLGNDPDDPVLLVGIGVVGQTEQRLAVTVYPQRDPLGCLSSAVAVEDQITLFNDTLRAIGTISANQVTSSVSSVYGDVEAPTITGSTYHGTTTVIDSSERPTMPKWQSVFDYYLTNGTQININDLPSTPPNLIRNSGFESGTTYWTGNPTGNGTATIQQSTSQAHSGAYSLRLSNLSGLTNAGAAQYIDDFVEPGEQYYVEAWFYLDDAFPELMWITLSTKGTGSVQTAASSQIWVPSRTWFQISTTLTAPAWSGDLEYAYILAGTPTPLFVNRLYVDDIVVRKAATGKYIYRQVLSPNRNPFGTGTTNPEGIYWIDCAGNRLIIERSRIEGTLLVLNPGSGSEIGMGPIHWSPAKPGYPALLVDADTLEGADFAIRANRRSLSEEGNGVNFNPTGSPDDELGEDEDQNDNYESVIQGLVVVGDTLNYSNSPLVRGEVIVGDDINNSSGSLEIEFQPESLISPPPGFLAPYKYETRPGAARKVVSP